MSWNKVHKYLSTKGYDVYSEGQHVGICDKMYVVLYEGETEGQNGNIVGKTYIEAMIVNPLNERSRLGERVKQLREDLKGLNLLQLTGFISGTIPQTEKKAHSKVIGCVINRRL